MIFKNFCKPQHLLTGYSRYLIALSNKFAEVIGSPNTILISYWRQLFGQAARLIERSAEPALRSAPFQSRIPNNFRRTRGFSSQSTAICGTIWRFMYLRYAHIKRRKPHEFLSIIRNVCVQACVKALVLENRIVVMTKVCHEDRSLP